MSCGPFMDACATEDSAAIDPYDSTFTLSSIPAEGSGGKEANNKRVHYSQPRPKPHNTTFSSEPPRDNKQNLNFFR